MTLLLTAVFAETCVDYVDNPPSELILLALTSEEMDDEVDRKTLAPVLLMNNAIGFCLNNEQ